MGICPKSGQHCTFDEHLDVLIDRRSEKKAGISAVREIVGIISTRGSCEGVFVEDVVGGTLTYCGHEKVDEMSLKARLAAESRGLAEELPDSLATIQHNR